MARQYTLWISARKDTGTGWFLGALALIIVVVPLLNQAVPASSAFHISAYGLTLVGKYLCYALLALSVDLIWGYCGILSLGQAAFFSLGGYAMGMYLMREIGPRGVYGDPILPDFMVFLNYKSLPWFWHGFNHFLFAMLMVAVGPGLLAFVFGWFAFRSRVTGVYLSIITQALTYALMLAFFRNDMGFGGNNGFTDFKDILGFDLHSDRVRVVLLVLTGIMLGASYLVCRMIVSSRAGRVIRAIRDAESRTRFLGYRVESYKLWIFVFFRHSCRNRGRAVRSADRHHQSQRIFADQLDRGGDLGGRGRTRHALRRGRRGTPCKLRQNLFYEHDSRSLELRAGRLVRPGYAIPSARNHRPRFRQGKKTRNYHAIPGPRRQAGAASKMSVAKTLYLENLTVSFDGFKALNDLTLQIDPGELRCIIGPNGAGKTTMMDVVTGKTKPDSGSVRFGEDLNLLSMDEPEIAQAGIGRKFQKPTIFERLTVFENLELALAGDKSFMKTLFARRTVKQDNRIFEVLEIIGLTQQNQALGGVLAHGQKQWLEIGMLLMQQPELLLVDEPVAGMTPQEIERTAELLKSLAGEHSVVVVEHDMEFVRSIAKRVTVLHEGHVLAEGNMDQVQSNPRVIEVYLGA
jgi:urea ABC transporter ATP-binding protein UrtD/urea ABC transporter permease protein UrtC